MRKSSSVGEMLLSHHQQASVNDFHSVVRIAVATRVPEVDPYKAMEKGRKPLILTGKCSLCATLG
jgi:hypothetical protein